MSHDIHIRILLFQMQSLTMIIARKHFPLRFCFGIFVIIVLIYILFNLRLNSSTSLYVLRNLITHEKNIKSGNMTRILCWIMTGPANHMTKAIHVRNTWGKRCDKLLFMSSALDEKLGSIALPNVKEGREFLYEKTRQAFKYVYENHFMDADWFFKADDDTYTIVENLRLLLQDYNTAHPIYFGAQVTYGTQLYMSGGAGYVLSKEALFRFVKLGLSNSTLCPSSTGSEDIEIGKCLQLLGVQMGDARDKFGRNRFLPLTPQDHLIPGNASTKNWYARNSHYQQKQGRNCCSNEGITFHYVPPAQFYVMDYLIYDLKPRFRLNR